MDGGARPGCGIDGNGLVGAGSGKAWRVPIAKDGGRAFVLFAALACALVISAVAGSVETADVAVAPEHRRSPSSLEVLEISCTLDFPTLASGEPSSASALDTEGGLEDR